MDPAAQHQDPSQLFAASALILCVSIHISASMAPVLIARDQLRIPAISSTFTPLDSVPWGVDTSSGVHCWFEAVLGHCP